MVLQRIGPGSLARVLAVIYACIGLIVGGIFTVFALLGTAIYNLVARSMGGVEIELVEEPAAPDGASDLTSAG